MSAIVAVAVHIQHQSLRIGYRFPCRIEKRNPTYNQIKPSQGQEENPAYFKNLRIILNFPSE